MTEYRCEKVLPYQNQNETKTQQVEQMFDSIASHYDTMNRLMSLYQDKNWRKYAIKRLSKENPKTILDVATGTGDFAIQAYDVIKPEKITGIDLSEKMLEVGKVKVANLNLSDRITLEKADSMSLPFADATFDSATVAFGVRNFESLEKGLSEICRVIKPGGSLAILELSEPTNKLYWLGYKVYTKLFIPIMAKLLKTSKDAYDYLPSSIEAFPQGKVMAELLKKSGFSKVEIDTYTMQTCTFYFATK